MKTSRNALCHCGSGKKYKHCHWKTDEDAQAAELEQAAADRAEAAALRASSEKEEGGGERGGRLSKRTPPAPPAPGRWKAPAALAAVGAVGTGALAYYQGIESAFVVGVAWIVVVALFTLFRSPPPPRDDAGHPASIDFGAS